MKRRNFLQLASGSLAVTTLDLTVWQLRAAAVQAAEPGILGQGDWRFRLVDGWGIQDPAAVPIRNLHEIVQDRSGLIYVLGDHPQNNILVYRPDGTLVRTLLSGLHGGHGLSISREGDDEFLWVTNTDGNLPVVRKVSLTGETVLEIGRPQVAPYDNPDAGYLPTEVEINPANGDIYIADGYGSSLLSHYDRQGKLLAIYGGSDDPAERYHCMHGVRLDLRQPDQPRLWLTSRQDQEIRIATLDGQVQQVIRFPGVGPCRASFVGDHVVVPIIWVDPIDGAGRGHGFVLILGPDNQPVSLVGGRQRTLESGDVHFAQAADQTLPFVFPHDAYVDGQGDLYVAQWNSGQTYPLKLQRVRG